jgi:hypothetical protein
MGVDVCNGFLFLWGSAYDDHLSGGVDSSGLLREGDLVPEGRKSEGVLGCGRYVH